MHVVLDIALISAITFSLLSNFYGLPGNIFIAFSSLIYGITTGFQVYSFTLVLTLFILLILFEFLEFLLISFTAKKYGASRWAIAGGILGGILGAVSGAFYSPVLGAIIGSVLGVFIGAAGLEFIKKRNLRESLLSGLGAFLGKLGGLTVKTTGAVIMSIMVLQYVL